MNVLIKQAKIIDPNSPDNGKKMDILIESGKIKAVKKTLHKRGVKTMEAKNLHVSPGWFDMHANFRDPGLEYKEDLQSGVKAAAHGGFTGVVIMPSTNPPIDSKSDVDYILSMTKNAIVEVYPAAALSEGLKGENLSEMFDMHNSGAVAFTDDKQSVANADLLKRALLYTKTFNGLVINFPNDVNISRDGKINEGINGTALGMKQIPSLAEELMLARDLSLVEYTESRMHFSTISTAKSVELLRKAKAKGLNVTAEVAAHQLALDDSELASFDSNYKVMPPLRTKADIKALIKGLKDGTIDAICSDHSPEDEENKKREFDHAAFGIIGLETAYAVANTTLGKHLSIEDIITKIAIKPREILGLDVPAIKEGNAANLTFFDPTLQWTFEEKHIHSKSKNTPFIGTEFTGKSLGIYNKGKLLRC